MSSRKPSVHGQNSSNHPAKAGTAQNIPVATDQQVESANAGSSDSAASFVPPGGSVMDRRSGIDRRDAPAALAGDGFGGSAAGLDRRRGPGRRLSDFSRSAEEGDLTSEQFLFVMAIEAFKRENNRTFPQWTDVLEVIRLLGYRKTCKSELKIRNAEDWMERSDTPANVRPKGWERRAA